MQILNLDSYFNADQKMKYRAIVNMIRNYSYIILASLFLIFGKGLFHIVIAFNISAFFTFLFGLVFLIKKITSVKLTINIKLCKNIIGAGFIFFIIHLFRLSTFKLDIVFLKLLANSEIVGAYSAADNIIVNMISILGCFLAALYPQMSILFRDSKPKLIQLYRKSRNIFFVLIFSLFFLIVLLARPIILIIYGSEFNESILVLQLLAIAGLFLLLSDLNKSYLISIDKEKQVLFAGGIASLLNIVLNLIFIPIYGLLGAVSTTVFSLFIYFILSSYFVLINNRFFKKKFIKI